MKLQKSPGEITVTNSGVSTMILGAFLVALGMIGAVVTIISGSVWYLTLICIGLVCIGGFIVLTDRSTKIVIRTQNLSRITTTRLIGGAAHYQEFDAHQVVRVSLVTRLINDHAQNGQSQTRHSTLKLVMGDNTEIIVGEKSQSLNLISQGVNVSNFQKAPLSEEAQVIADFLGVSVEAVDMSNPLTAISEVVDTVTHKTTPPTNPL